MLSSPQHATGWSVPIAYAIAGVAMPGPLSKGK